MLVFLSEFVAQILSHQRVLNAFLFLSFFPLVSSILCHDIGLLTGLSDLSPEHITKLFLITSCQFPLTWSGRFRATVVGYLGYHGK